MIENTVNNKNNKLSLKALCEIAGVSRSGYYSWYKAKNSTDSAMNQKELNDKRDFELILQAFQFRGYNKGSRGIRMRLLHMGIVMNRKKIKRLMKKFNLFCPIRKANPYRRIAKAIKTSNYADNILERQFEKYGPGYVLLTDITYFFYGPDRAKCFLSVVKDAFTKQILAYKLSQSLEEEFVLETVNMLLKEHGSDIHVDALIHSDQGAHYTSVQFIKLLSDAGLRQSMSRRGNCWDNAPQESFFGHMKDELGIKVKKCTEFAALSKLIDDYIDYYNNDRYQMDLANLSPNEFLSYYRTGVYPLKAVIDEPEDINNKIEKIKSDRQNPNLNECLSEALQEESQ